MTGRSKRLQPDIVRRAIRRLEHVDLATCIDDLRVPPSNRLHNLKGDREGQYAISINDQWRICFRHADGDAYDVEITDYHREVHSMSIRNEGIRKIRPAHPGEMLREDFMPDYGLTVASLAAALGTSRQTVNELFRERRAMSPAVTLKLVRLFGNSPEFWLNAQRAVDLWEAGRRHRKEIERIIPLPAA